MRIAVIGAGLLGLACAYTLSTNKNARVSLFDKEGIASGASGIAAGLLHPFAGKKATLNWNGFEAYHDAIKLLTVSSNTLGRQVMQKSGIFRPATSSTQVALFQKASQLHPECIWKDDSELQHPGIFIPCGVQVDCPLYLSGLFKACLANGVTFDIATIQSSQELDQFDLAIFTVGAGFDAISGLKHPPIHAVKGQLLELEYDAQIPYGISSQSYIAQVQEGSIVAGSTYEHSWNTPGPDLATCEQEIRSKTRQFSHTFADLKLLSCKAGFRATTQDKKPFIAQSGAKSWCLGGLGSKGLLYHAWLANSLQTLVFAQKQ